MVVITSNQRDVILDAVRRMYTEVALSPQQGFHFPTGRHACEFVGYPPDRLKRLPRQVIESFAGVGYPFAAEAVGPADTVLDIGSGSGTDVFLAAEIVGPDGRVIALDMTEAMRDKLRRSLDAAGIRNVEVVEGNAEEIPLADQTVDVVTSNGVLNLVPDKRAAIREIYRVLRPGGRVQIADIVLGRRASEACRTDPELWAECIVGATTETAYLEHFRAAGFPDVEVLGRFDYFAGSNPDTREVAESLGAISIILSATRSAEPPRTAWLDLDTFEEDGEGDLSPPLMDLDVRTDRVYDAGAMSCGEVTPIVRRELREIRPGQVLAVRSEIPLAGLELLAWCRMTGHQFLGSTPADASAELHHIRRKQE